MNWDDLKVILAIHRAGSMSKAASLLDVDQSTITRRLAAIERDIGAVLFVRSKAGLRANDAGRVAIEQSLQVERVAERLVDRLPHKRSVPQGEVQLLSNPWVLAQLARHGLGRLRSDYPEIDLLMIAGTEQLSIVQGDTDLALWFEIPPGDGEFALPLCEVSYGLFVPEGRDEDDVEWMTFWDRKERREPMRWLTKQLPANGRMALKTNDPQALLGAIQAGEGKALLPVCYAQDRPGIRRVEGFPSLQRTLHLHAHPDLVQSPRIQSVMRWLRYVAPRVFPGD